MKRSPLFWPSLVLLLGMVGGGTAAIIPAIVPVAAPTTSIRGTTTPASGAGIFQLAANTTAGAAGAAICDDGSGNTTTSGCTANAVTSTSPATVNTNTTGDQQLMELSLSAGYLNSLGRPFDFFGAGVYTTQAAQTPTLTFKIKLCTVSGCGSGTVVTLVSITTGATTAASTNISWNVRALAVTAATGASGNLEIHGPASVDLGSALSTAATVYNDTNTAVSSNINLAAALFADFTVAFSTNAATANICTQRSGVVSPGGSTSGGGGGGAFTQISKQTLGSAASSITFSSIPATSNNLMLTIMGRGDTAATSVNVIMQANGDTGTNYNSQFILGTGSVGPSTGFSNATASAPIGQIAAANAPANVPGVITAFVYNYANTTFFKQANNLNGTRTASNTNDMIPTWWEWASTAAINQLVVSTTAGNFSTGTTAILYGVN